MYKARPINPEWVADRVRTFRIGECTVPPNLKAIIIEYSYHT